MACRKFHQERVVLQGFPRKSKASTQRPAHPQGRPTIPLGPISIGFLRQSGAANATQPVHETRAYTGRTILLNFASPPTRQFRFVSTVTNLQQAVRYFSRW